MSNLLSIYLEVTKLFNYINICTYLLSENRRPLWNDQTPPHNLLISNNNVAYIYIYIYI